MDSDFDSIFVLADWPGHAYRRADDSFRAGSSDRFDGSKLSIKRQSDTLIGRC